jgi:hypothetical protein
LQQREWISKHHERIFDGLEGLLSKRQQTQQQRMEMNDIAAPIRIDSRVPLTLVTEKQSPRAPEGQISVPDRVYGYCFNHESGKEGKTGYMTHQGDGGELYNRRKSREKAIISSKGC